MRVGLGKKRGTHMEGGTDGQGDSRSGFFHDKRKRPGAKCFHMLKVIIFSLHIEELHVLQEKQEEQFSF